MIKKYSLLTAAFFALFSLRTEKANAQISGTDAYIQGTSVELGIAGAGGFEGANTTTSPVPAGMHFRSNTNFFGFVANPQLNSWATFDGDYFTPGTPENGWGFEIGASGGAIGNNNCTGPNDMVGTSITYSHIGTVYSVDWEGDATSGTDLHFKINYLLNQTDLFYTTTVWITNNSLDTIPDLYFYRNLDPDNNVTLTSDYVTGNLIVDQTPANGGSSVANVSATQSLPWSSYVALVGDPSFKAGFGGFSNRDASDMFNGTGFTQNVGGTDTADVAIYLACDIQNLLPADVSTHTHRSTVAPNTRCFRFITSFDPNATVCAVRGLQQVSQAGYPTVSSTSSAFVLTGGSPAGGTYSGTGVSGNMFDPATSGPGLFDIIYSYTDSTGCTGMAVSQMHVADATTGVAANTMNAHVNLYPNPFSDETTISVGTSVKLDNASVHIYDMVGKEVKVVAATSNEIKIDRKGLAGGMYFYKLINNNQQIASGKMIIK
ncbi:MAG: domain containing protein [Bacteroidetes bacterium]|nr:domain containing protein [Bacteroidota bacterium]